MGMTLDVEAPARRETGPSHRVRNVLIVVVVVLVAAELFTRAIASDLPAPLQWESYEAQTKVQQINALSKKGGAQVAFIGSSMIDVGVDPTVVDDQLGPGVTSYNAGLASSIPRMSVAWAESVVIPKLHPKVVVLGLCGYDFGANNSAAIYDAYLGTQGASQALHRTSVLQTLNRWIGDVSDLWYYKYQLRDPETVLRAIAGRKQPVDAASAALTPSGRETEDQYVPYDGNLPLDVQGWTLGNKDVAAVEQLISFAHQRGITVVLVDMPVTNQFVSAFPTGESDYRTFEGAVKEIGARTGSEVLNYDNIRNTDMFGDDIHLNHNGAEYFSAKIGAALKPLVAGIHTTS